jgi:hypothetical protein
MVSKSHRVSAAVYRRVGRGTIPVDDLKKIATTAGLDWPGQNGGLFGLRRPYMRADGCGRLLTADGLRRIGAQ